MELEGVFSVDGELYHIKNIASYLNSRRDDDIMINMALDQKRSDLIILKEEDEATSNLNQCGVNSVSSIFKRSEKVSMCGTDTINGFRAIEQIKLSKILGVNKADSGCPTSKKLLLMGVAADCSYVVEKGSRTNALNAILTNWNAASKVFEDQFNVQLGVGKVLIQESCTPSDPVLTWNRDCSNTAYTITNRLSDFSQWRGTQSDEMGLWHLMTKCSTQPAVGIAWLSTVCQKTTQTQPSSGGNQFVSGTGVSSIVPVEWKVIAHEIGHNVLYY